jgi:hypothetical protein
MVRLNNPHVQDITKADFDKYPIWVWDNGNEGFLPISDAKYTNEYGTLFIKANFESDGYRFDGYLVGDSSFYAFGIFIDDDEIGFNVNLTDFVQKGVDKISKKLKINRLNLFPLRYTSPVCYEDGSPISGLFILKYGELFNQPDNSKEKIWSKSDFQECPIWTYDDIKGIIPIYQKKILPENFMGLFVGALFTAPDGHTFEGFLIGSRKFYAFALFVKDEKIMFHLPDLNKNRIAAIFEILNSDPFRIFPLRYVSSASFEDTGPISGNFILKNEALLCVPDAQQTDRHVAQ